MVEDDWNGLFSRIRGFGWDKNKRNRVLREREIDFDDARFVLNGPTFVRRSDRDGEVRYMVFGFLDDVEVVIICTLRDELCWIISARRARRDERKKYYDRLPRRPAPGQDQLG